MSYDSFDFKARTLPVVVAFAPAYLCAALLMAAFPSVQNWKMLVPLPVVIALSVIATHLGRDSGKKVEQVLWEEWGGPPTTTKLRWATAGNPIMHQERHRELQAIVGQNIELPNAEQEQQDPTRADQIYEAAVSILIARTGDHSKLKNDLIGYCFRRNVFGLRKLAYFVSIALGSIAVLILVIRVPIEINNTIPIVTFVGSLGWIILYTFWFTPGWVRQGADAYANELLKHVHIRSS